MIEFFTNPILRAPTIATLLMCLSASLIGVLVFLKKRSLLSETLSHTTYPGVILALIGLHFFSIDENSSLLILGGAFLTAWSGCLLLKFLEKKAKLKEDSALSFVLTSFFAIGITLGSLVQAYLPQEWQKVHTYLYGKIATMTDFYIVLYTSFFLIVVLTTILFFKELKVFLFDHNFAITSRMNIKIMEHFFIFLSVLAVVCGMRSVGLVLISAMLIAPAVFARAFTDNLKMLFFLSAMMSLVSAFFGIFLSLKLSTYYQLSIPVGPIIVLMASFLSILALLFAPKRGLILRYCRMLKFQFDSLNENLLKMLWREQNKHFCFSSMASFSGISKFYLWFALLNLQRRGDIKKIEGNYFLTTEGQKFGAKIVRLHRLWEVYLVSYLGIHAQKVHKSAEEIEHILTPDLEKALTDLLDNPNRDPHDQPIPPNEAIVLEVSRKESQTSFTLPQGETHVL
jgi:manganese/zinc/iron transport system permease protein